MEEPTKQKGISLQKWFEGILRVHGIGSYLLLRITEDGSLELLGAAGSPYHLGFVLDMKNRNELTG